MKKSFMFVAVAAAGMLASCSSDSLTAGSDPTIEPGQKDLVPIEISVATPVARATTRGTGTVGGVELANGTAVNNDGTTTGTPKANIWAGQKVNVYMFNKGTLDLAQFDGAAIFDNAVMDTPPATETTKSGLAHYVDPAVPASGRYLVKYYPLTGAYDFWGYRIDNAATTAVPAVAGDKLSVVITVDGSQDVLGAKTTDPDLSGTNPTLTTADLYSAKAARQNIQPELEFNHLMSRLTFEAYPGNDNAKTVYVTGIKVRALNAYNPADPTATVYQTPTGTLDIAGTDNGFKQKITWGTNAAAPAQFVLMKRQGAVLGQDAYQGIGANEWYKLTADEDNKAEFISAAKYAAINKLKTDYTLLVAGSWYSDNNDPTNVANFVSQATHDADPVTYAAYTAIAADSWYALTAAATDNTQFISATAYDALPTHPQGDYSLLAADSWYALRTASTDNTQFISATAYGTLPATSTAADTDGNKNLIALIDANDPTAWATNGAITMNLGATDGTVKAPIGESIIAPDAQAYEIEIDLAQKVAKYEDSNPNAVPLVEEDWQEYQFNTVKTVVKASDAGATRFLPGYTYDFIFKVYGLEKIQVTTVLKPWIYGEQQEIITE